MRVYTEINQLLKKYKSVMIEQDDNNKNIIVKINKRKFIIPSNYPHYPPIVFVNNKPYLDYIIPPTYKIEYLLGILLKNKKIDSITEFINWRPTNSLLIIMNEIENVNRIKQKIKYIITTYEIAEKFNIPFEMKHEIYTFL